MGGLFKKKEVVDNTNVSGVDDFSTFSYDKFEKQYIMLKKTIEASDANKRLLINIDRKKQTK